MEGLGGEGALPLATHGTNLPHVQPSHWPVATFRDRSAGTGLQPGSPGAPDGGSARPAPDNQIQGAGLIRPRYPAGISSQQMLDDNLIIVCVFSTIARNGIKP